MMPPPQSDARRRNVMRAFALIFLSIVQLGLPALHLLHEIEEHTPHSQIASQQSAASTISAKSEDAAGHDEAHCAICHLLVQCKATIHGAEPTIVVDRLIIRTIEVRDDSTAGCCCPLAHSARAPPEADLV